MLSGNRVMQTRGRKEDHYGYSEKHRAGAGAPACTAGRGRVRQIVSKTLAQNDAVSITLFAFSKGEEISTHASGGDAMVLVLEGRGRFTIDGREHFCSAGESIVMPAGKPHAVYAAEDFKMLLTVVFPQN